MQNELHVVLELNLCEEVSTVYTPTQVKTKLKCCTFLYCTVYTRINIFTSAYFVFNLMFIVQNSIGFTLKLVFKLYLWHFFCTSNNQPIEKLFPFQKNGRFYYPKIACCTFKKSLCSQHWSLFDPVSQPEGIYIRSPSAVDANPWSINDALSAKMFSEDKNARCMFLFAGDKDENKPVVRQTRLVQGRMRMMSTSCQSSIESH